MFVCVVLLVVDLLSCWRMLSRWTCNSAALGGLLLRLGDVHHKRGADFTSAQYD